MISHFRHAKGATIHSLAIARASKEKLAIQALPDFPDPRENQHLLDLMALLDKRDNEESEEKREIWGRKGTE